MPMQPTHRGVRFILFTIFLFTVLFCVNVSFSKTTSFVALNQFHNGVLDWIFIVLTYLGDGALPVILALVLIFYKKHELSIKILSAYLLSGALAQILKAAFHEPRPKPFLSSIHYNYPYFIEGITHSGSNSFPSGHTTTAFALATTLAYNTSCKNRCLMYFLLATLTLYSRIYLGQHFLQDTLAGLLIGTSTAMLIEYIASRIKNRKAAAIPEATEKSLMTEA